MFFNIIISITFKYLSDQYLSHECVHVVFYLTLDIEIFKMYGLGLYSFSSKRLSLTLCEASKMGSDAFNPVGNWVDLRWSWDFYKAWFTHRLGVASRESEWLSVGPPSLFGRLWKPSSVSQASWDSWQFHPVFHCFLPGFLDFALNSLRSVTYRGKNDAKCWAFLNNSFLWSLKSWLLWWEYGSVTEAKSTLWFEKKTQNV